MDFAAEASPIAGGCSRWRCEAEDNDLSGRKSCRNAFLNGRWLVRDSRAESRLGDSRNETFLVPGMRLVTEDTESHEFGSETECDLSSNSCQCVDLAGEGGSRSARTAAMLDSHGPVRPADQLVRMLTKTLPQSLQGADDRLLVSIVPRDGSAITTRVLEHFLGFGLPTWLAQPQILPPQLLV